LLNDHQSKGDLVVPPRDWCTEWVGDDYEELTVTGVLGMGLSILTGYANEWAYLYRDANKGEFGND